MPHAPVSTGLAAHVCYIDNLAAVASSPEEAEAVLSQMEAGLQDFGLILARPEAEEATQLLGCDLVDGHF